MTFKRKQGLNRATAHALMGESARLSRAMDSLVLCCAAHFGWRWWEPYGIDEDDVDQQREVLDRAKEELTNMINEIPPI